MKRSILSKWVSVGILLAVMPLAVASARAANLPGDAEATVHGDEAANVQRVQETEQKSADFVFRQYNLAVLSHYSYLIGSGGEAMIVDPARDVGIYLKDAQELGLKITRVFLTHSHADFVAGHMELAKAAGAEIIVNEATQAGYPHKPVKDGEAIIFGKVRAVIVTTPGHTPDGVCLYVYHPASETNPTFVLTGDTLFIGSVGRPDLMGDGMSAAELAEMGYHSWKDKLSRLPDDTKFFPAHGAGSLCGVNLSDKPVSTIGEQRRENSYLQHKEGGSEAWIAGGLPTLSAPGIESGHGSAARSVTLPQRIAAAELKRMLMDLPGTFEIVDVRPPALYADFSLPGSINADIADVITNPAYLNGAVPLIIVDRDGSLAMAVGGILSQRTQRSIRVLYGGLEAYWNDAAALLPPVAPASIPAVKPAAPVPAPAVPAVPAVPAPAAPQTPKKKSAGC